MHRTFQISESIRLGILLAISGGFMDAYSYLVRGNVFANAQTGNLVLLGIHLSQGRFHLAIKYLFPVLAFAAGIFLADLVRIKRVNHLHWRQNAVLVEAVILALVAFFPQNMNLAANSLASLACGIQVESFRKIHGNAIATTMCIGNLRSGTENLCKYIFHKDTAARKKAFLYFGIIFFFVLGAISGYLVIQSLAELSILCCCALQILAFLMMSA